MYTRYDIRNACFRMKQGATPKNQEIVDLLTPLIKEKNFSWHSFGDSWDVVNHVTKGLIPIKFIRDLSKVESVCSQMVIITENKIIKEWNLEEQSIIESIEAQFLDGIMDWPNYRITWGVKQDTDSKRIVTTLLNRNTNQIEVTQEMIDAKAKNTMSSNSAEEARENINTVQAEITLG